MKNLKLHQICSGLFSLIMGAMLLLLRGSVLSTVITIIGIGFIVSGLIPGVKHITKLSLLKIIIGISTIVFGSTYINLSMYILGIALIILGIFRFISSRELFKNVPRKRHVIPVFIRPILTLAAGICIFLNPAGSTEALFSICGILLIAGGIWDMYTGAKIRS